MFIDAHAHLDQYTHEELEVALSEIRRYRILTISTAMDLPAYKRVREIGEQCKLVLPSFGVHPWNAPHYVARLDDLSDAIASSPLLGEVGLDRHFVKNKDHYEAQQRVFEFFLAEARDQDKIVNLHTKGAEVEVLHLLDRFEIRRAIVHWYSGPLDIFRDLVARGAYFTIGVELLHSRHIQTLAKTLPAERLLTETDNPGGLRWLTGTTGMPGAIRQIVGAIAAQRAMSVQAVRDAVQANFLRLVRDDQWLADVAARAIEGRSAMA